MYRIYKDNIDITEVVSNAFLSNPRKVGVLIQLPALTLTNEHVIECNIEEGVITQDKFVFGTANVSVAEITINNIGNTIDIDSLEKQEMKIFFTVEVDGEVYKVPMGLFVIDTVSEDSSIISVSAYDKLILSEENYNLNTELTYPTTLKDIAKNACDIAKIPFKETAFLNSDLQLNDMVIFGANNTCRDVLQNVAELACGYVRSDKDGFIELIDLHDDSVSCNIRPEHYFKFKKAESLFGPIASVRIAKDETVELFGEGSPQFQIDDNYYLPGNFKHLPEKLYNHISNIQFMPADLEFQGNPLIEPGDFIQVTTKEGQEHKLLVSSMKYTYNGSLRCTLKSTSNSDMSLATEKKNIISESVEGLNRRFNELKKLIDKKIIELIMKQQDEFNNRMDGLEKEVKEVQIKVTPDGIVNTVTNSKQYGDIIDGIYDGLNGLSNQTINIESIIAQYAENINLAIKKGNIISEINLDTSGVQIRGDKIKLTGVVTFEDLQGEGTTIINGNNITTGTLSGDRIHGGTIEAVNIKGDNVDVMANLSVSPASEPSLDYGSYDYQNPNNDSEWSTIDFKVYNKYNDRLNEIDEVKLKVFPYGDAMGIDNDDIPKNPEHWKYGLEINGAIRAMDNIIIKGQEGLLVKKVTTDKIAIKNENFANISVDDYGMQLNISEDKARIYVENVQAEYPYATGRKLIMQATGGYYFADPDGQDNMTFNCPAIYLRPSEKYAEQSIIMTTGSTNSVTPNPVKFLNGEQDGVGKKSVNLNDANNYTGIYTGYLAIPAYKGGSSINSVIRRKRIGRRLDDDDTITSGSLCNDTYCNTQPVYGGVESSSIQDTSIKHITNHTLSVSGTSGTAEVVIDLAHLDTMEIRSIGTFVNFKAASTSSMPKYTAEFTPTVSPRGNFKAWWTGRVKLSRLGKFMQLSIEIGYEKPNTSSQNIDMIILSKTPIGIESTIK